MLYLTDTDSILGKRTFLILGKVFSDPFLKGRKEKKELFLKGKKGKKKLLYKVVRSKNNF